MVDYLEQMDILYICMPAYNEEENIDEVVKQWYVKLEGKSDKSRIVVADSGSTDKTHEILLKIKNQGYTKLEILSDTNRYHGPKLIAMYNYALSHGADYIFQTDSDGQTNPDEFDAFWNIRDEYAGIFGNRTVREDGRDRAFVEKVVCCLLKVFFGVSVPDANAPFRLMRADVVSKYMDFFEPSYNLPNIMITTFFVYYKERTAFQKITFKPRRAGNNSINFIRIVKIGIRALGGFGTFRSEMKRRKKSINKLTESDIKHD